MAKAKKNLAEKVLSRPKPMPRDRIPPPSEQRKAFRAKMRVEEAKHKMEAFADTLVDNEIKKRARKEEKVATRRERKIRDV